MASSVRWVCDSCTHSLVGGGELVHHYDSGVLEISMPVRSVELHPYGPMALE